MYAVAHGGRYPDDFAALYLSEDLTSEVFICASSQGERAVGDTPEATAKLLSQPLHMTYVYAGKGLTAPVARPGETILAYERLENHNRDGMNVLYADGHVEFQPKAAAEHFVAELAAGHNPPPAAGR